MLQVTVSDGEWHVIRITRKRRRALLKVDNHKPVRGRADKGVSVLQTDGNLWLGQYFIIFSPINEKYQFLRNTLYFKKHHNCM